MAFSTSGAATSAGTAMPGCSGAKASSAAVGAVDEAFAPEQPGIAVPAEVAAPEVENAIHSCLNVRQRIGRHCVRRGIAVVRDGEITLHAGAEDARDSEHGNGAAAHESACRHGSVPQVDAEEERATRRISIEVDDANGVAVAEVVELRIGAPVRAPRA